MSRMTPSKVPKRSVHDASTNLARDVGTVCVDALCLTRGVCARASARHAAESVSAATVVALHPNMLIGFIGPPANNRPTRDVHRERRSPS